VNKAREHCLVIDPGLDTDRMIEAIRTSGLRPIAILCTHGHFDHIAGVEPLKKMYGIKYFIHESDVRLSRSANFFLHVTKIDHKIDIPSPDVEFKGFHDIHEIGDFKVDVFNFPGHTPGSCVLKVDDNLFTGDTIYKNGLGTEHIPANQKQVLRNSISDIFSTFTNDSIVIPGHGASDTLGSIKLNNSKIKDFLENESSPSH
jgi:hydroxyacylglutathione hydrolase